MTIYGPHRDDFYFEFKNNDLKYFGSQGQQKLAILAFKLSEIPIFKEYCGTTPVLLLDDIFSELDIKKRNSLLKLINLDNIQSIITTTDLRNINKKYIGDSYIFNVNNGNIERK
jgi:DNA replication and repair protein RecF